MFINLYKAMRKTFLCILLVINSVLIVRAQTITSPDKNLTLSFALRENGIPAYQLTYKNKPVIKSSKLGIETKDVPSFMDSFTIVKI
jgi:hypothetical protein